MSQIHNIKLEILRSGPSHNQLLSPLTPYLILCGAAGPVTVHLPFEQRQLLIRLERLRYYTGGMPVPPGQREAELRELGEAIGRIFGQVSPFLGELAGARAKKGRFVHLRLSLSAFELALLPFETAIAPNGFPGSGSPLFLQSKIPITITREIRRGRPLPVEWDRPPRILFISASPHGFARVPVKGHLMALRRAIDPWVKIRDTEEERLEAVKKMLTVLPDATLEQVRQASMDTEYSHVHILAHGAPYDRAGDRRSGLALCSGKNPLEADVIDGEALAIALTANRASATAARRRPTVLSLATCDSGNVHSVLTPGGSLAHELHAAGIPWVFASQFPPLDEFFQYLHRSALQAAPQGGRPPPRTPRIAAAPSAPPARIPTTGPVSWPTQPYPGILKNRWTTFATGRPVSGLKPCLHDWTICSLPGRPMTRMGKGFQGRRIISAVSSAGNFNPGGKNPPHNPAPRNWPNGWA